MKILGVAFAALLIAPPDPALAQTVTTFAGSRAGSADGPRQLATFRGPRALALDRAGDLYVGDAGNYRIRKISREAVTTFFGTGTYDFKRPEETSPHHLATDSRGTLYVVDVYEDYLENYDGRLRAISPSGEIAELLPGPWVTAVTVGRDDTLYAVDTVGLLRRGAEGAFSTVAAKRVGYAALAADGRGSVYLLDYLGLTLWRISADGEVARVAGSGQMGRADGPGDSASFKFPRGLAVDRRGNLYVADTENHLIRKVDRQGVVSTFAGTGAAGDKDGFGTAASFRFPMGLALDCAGNLYVADNGNDRIRVVTVPEPAAGCESEWAIPAVARVHGANGSFWKSELVLHNRGAEETEVHLRFLTEGGSADASLALPPHASVTVDDVLGTTFGLSAAFGWLRLSADGDVAVRTRTYSASSGGSVGDNVPGLPLSAFFSESAAPPPVLTGLREDQSFRTNLILVNGTTAPVELNVRADDASGAPLGGRTYTLPPSGMLQDSRLLARPEFGGAGSAGAMVTVFSSTPGARFYALATVIDNTSNDPTTILPQ